MRNWCMILQRFAAALNADIDGGKLHFHEA